MSLVQPQQPPDRKPSPGLSVNLTTNNPFRRGANSPSLNSPVVSTTPTERPPSRNPFIDKSSEMATVDVRDRPGSPQKAPAGAPLGEPETLIKNLSIDNKDENMPPPMSNGHRPSRSGEDPRRRGPPRPRPNETLDIFADPPTQRRPPGPRPRRNSDTSLADRSSKNLEEDDRRRRERRPRDVPRDSKGRPIPPSGPRGKRGNHRLDIIDKLDVTSIFGTGVFHHDGPFDACNPARNRQGSKRAPMQAFPKDSTNMALGGSGPVNKNINLAQFHGVSDDSYKDYNHQATKDSGSGRPLHSSSGSRDWEPRPPPTDRPGNFNPGAKVDQLHGHETMGLGTSTFLEGAPAARVAIQRRESEGDVGGLTRKKSLAQKIRGISNNRDRRPYIPAYAPAVGSPEPERAISPDGVQSAGLPKIAERNPFFNNYDDAYDSKGATIKSAAEGKEKKAHISVDETEPGDNAIRRTLTEGAPADGTRFTEEPRRSDNTNGSDGKSTGGFLNRVKSLRSGGRGKARAPITNITGERKD